MSHGNTVSVFSKFYKNNKNDFYNDFIAPVLGDDLIVESWGRPI